MAAVASTSWRLRDTGTSIEFFFRAKEIQFLDSGGANLATGGSAFSVPDIDPGFADGFGPQRCFDGDLGTWGTIGTTGGVVGGIIGYNFSGAVLPARVKVYLEGTGGNLPQNLAVEFMGGNGQWVEAAVLAGPFSAESYEVEIPAAPPETGGKITGTVTLNGSPSALPVKAFKLSDTTFKAETASDSSGAYTLEISQEGRCYVFAHQPYGSRFTASQAVAVGDIVRPTEHNNYLYECKTAGVLPDEEPQWPTTLNEEVTVGDAVFVTKRMFLPKIHGPVFVEAGEGTLPPIEVGVDSMMKSMTKRIWPTVSYTPEVGSGERKFCGAVLVRNGKVLLVPRKNSAAAVYDPISNSFENLPLGGLDGDFRGGCLLHSGRVYCTPCNSETAVIFDPEVGRFSATVAFGAGKDRFIGCLVLTSGHVFNVPFNNTHAVVYNPNTDTAVDISFTDGGSGAFSGGVLLPDGRVYCVPYNRANAVIYDQKTGEISDTATLSGSAKFSGGVVLPDGRVFNVPFNYSSATIYDPATDSYFHTPSIGSGTAKFSGGALLPDGRVYCSSYDNSVSCIYDPKINAVYEVEGTSPGYQGVVLLPDGRVLSVPSNKLAAALVSTGTCPDIPLEVCLNPMFNKF